MPALDAFRLFAHNSTFRVVVVTVVLAAVHSPVPLCARLILQTEAMLEVWLCASSRELPRSETYSP